MPNEGDHRLTTKCNETIICYAISGNCKIQCAYLLPPQSGDRPAGQPNSSSLLRTLKSDDLRQRPKLIILLRDTAGRRSAQRHDLPGIGKPLADDRIVLGDFAQLIGDAQRAIAPAFAAARTIRPRSPWSA